MCASNLLRVVLAIGIHGLLCRDILADDGAIPLVEPRSVIEFQPLPKNVTLEIPKERALELAAKYSGFPADETVTVRAGLFSDKEYPRFGKAPLPAAVPAWVVYFSKATVEMPGPEGRTKQINCPMHVAVDGQSGKFLCAYGDSAVNWAKGRPDVPVNLAAQWDFSEPKDPPELTVKEVLQKFNYRRDETGQVFVRYSRIFMANPSVPVRRADPAEEMIPILPEFNCWLFSLRGVIHMGGFSTPVGYEGPELYSTRLDNILDDNSGKVIMCHRN